ncbi:unnamed protein product [Eruca vesicaria subsp. sativa]|uniref:Uncharacterized protein n=1 Tax=Eruca vesicaria subsp. sativa TaxID=29727 RepID=A0ABC8KLB9_ERUVS|nr:unnamed protein product [Eruca vesicaria subsp. sativa]
MVSIMKIMMIMALLVIGVNARTINECKKSVCKSVCHPDHSSVECGDCLLKWAYPPPSEIKTDQRTLCLKRCAADCVPNYSCYRRCIEDCPKPALI